VKAAALSRWAGWAAADALNPWAALLLQFIDELEAAWGGTALPRAMVLESLLEFGMEARRSESGRLFVSTVHGAKGREFRHVAILDGGDWHTASEEERRLYYVGMTRSRETLTLCEAVRAPNPFSSSLGNAPGLLRSAARPLPGPRELRRRYVALGLRDVDLGYAGQYPASHPVNAALGAMRHGDALQIVAGAERREIKTASGITVGRLSKSCALPPGRIVQASVASVVHRTRAGTDPDYRARARTEEWRVLLPLVVIDPAPARRRAE
jgi:ATP-dependent DNA helicase RecQ